MIIRRALVVCAALLLEGCARSVDIVPGGAMSIEPTCQMDRTRLLSWSTFHEVGSLAPAPYVASYRGCGQALDFVAVEHTNDPHSLTFDLVKQAASAAGVGLVIVEGLPSDYGMSNPQVLAIAAAAEGTLGDSEALVAIRTAALSGLPFQGAEPNDHDIVVQAERAGIQASDVLGFYVLRQIEQSVRAGELVSHTDPALSQLIERELAQLSRRTRRPEAEFTQVSTIEGFKDWYFKLNGQPFDISFAFEDAYPSTSEHERPSNVVADTISDIRERAIIQTIEAALDKHSKIIVIYGASHHDIQRPVFEAAFGPAMLR